MRKLKFCIALCCFVFFLSGCHQIKEPQWNPYTSNILYLGKDLYLTLDSEISEREILMIHPPQDINIPKRGSYLIAQLSKPWGTSDPKQSEVRYWESNPYNKNIAVLSSKQAEKLYHIDPYNTALYYLGEELPESVPHSFYPKKLWEFQTMLEEAQLDEDVLYILWGDNAEQVETISKKMTEEGYFVLSVKDSNK